MRTEEFEELRYGMFIHYGLYSMLGRGEWAMNREQIPAGDYCRIANSFRGEKFDAEAIVKLALESGMRYIVFTTMHRDGFRMYDSELSDFCSAKSASRRDFTAEIIAACRKYGLKTGLYHSLGQWSDTPSSADALEDPAARARFMDATMARLKEVVTKFRPFDIFWYDGAWPFDASGWRAEELNAMVRELNPGCLVNDRNGLAGDFATSEQRITPPSPWRPWEACVTSNTSWGFHRGDQRWKSPLELVELLAGCAAGKGNLLLNVGLMGDGSVPGPAADLLKETSKWLARNGEAIFGTELFSCNHREQVTPDSLKDRANSEHRSDWNHYGPMTAKKDSIYQFMTRWIGDTITIGGVLPKVRQVFVVGPGTDVAFKQDGTRLTLSGLPDSSIDPLCTVIRIRCDRPPALYNCAGPRIPEVDHYRYDS